jgi:hypothetical protein
MFALVLAVLLGAAPQGGTVYTADGGRLRGTVLDSGPGGVSVQLADGSTRKLEASQVSRVDFADGTTWKPAATAAVAAAPAAAQGPAPSGQAAGATSTTAGAQSAAPVAVAAAVPVAAAAKPAPLAIPVEKLDTVFIAKGGRVRCLVVEEGPDGVVVRLLDGAERRYAPGQVSRIDWADGTRSDLPPPPAPAPPAPAQAR